MNFEEIVGVLCENTQTNVEQGKRFEKLIKKILQVDSFLREEFNIKEVYLWNEFSDKFQINRHDFGIDIVILSKEEEILAVQCKAFSPTYSLRLNDFKNFLGINSFVDNNDKIFKISQSLIFHTCKSVSGEVGKALEQNANGEKAKAIAFGYNELKDLEIDWQKINLDAIEQTTQSKDKKKLRPHQQEAFEAIRKHFVEQDNARGKVIMACGTGKSLLAIRTIDDIVKDGEIAVFFTPSLALTNQMIKEFFAQSLSKSYKVFAVCSDNKVGLPNSTNTEDMNSDELYIAPTTDSNVLARKIAHLLHKEVDNSHFTPPPSII